jgi:hypothetical protein
MPRPLIVSRNSVLPESVPLSLPIDQRARNSATITPHSIKATTAGMYPSAGVSIAHANESEAKKVAVETDP